MHRGPEIGPLALVALVALVALLAAACSGGGEPASPAGPSETPRTAPAPVLIQGDVRTGEARVEVSGAVEATLDLTEIVSPNVFSPPPGGMAITWRDPRGDLLGIGGRTFTGTRRTARLLVLSLAVRVKAGFVDLTSGPGECRVTIDRADGTGIEGSFDCSNLGKGAQSVRATGTFAASP